MVSVELKSAPTAKFKFKPIKCLLDLVFSEDSVGSVANI